MAVPTVLEKEKNNQMIFSSGYCCFMGIFFAFLKGLGERVEGKKKKSV